MQRICRRDTLLSFFEHASPAIVGMEACPGSQWLGRKLRARVKGLALDC
jgi:transposase